MHSQKASTTSIEMSEPWCLPTQAELFAASPLRTSARRMLYQSSNTQISERCRAHARNVELDHVPEALQQAMDGNTGMQNARCISTLIRRLSPATRLPHVSYRACPSIDSTGLRCSICSCAIQPRSHGKAPRHWPQQSEYQTARFLAWTSRSFRTTGRSSSEANGAAQKGPSQDMNGHRMGPYT